MDNNSVKYVTTNEDVIANVKLKFRRKTDAQWSSCVDIIPDGEPCFNTDTGEVRVGDGKSVWSQLKPILGLISNQYRRELLTDADGISKQFTTLIIDDGDLE